MGRSILKKIPDILFNGLPLYQVLQNTSNNGVFVGPVQDINGEWFISDVVWDMIEFQYLKTEYPEMAALFTDAAYTPPEPLYKIGE